MDKLVFSAEALAKSIGIDGKNEIVFEEYFDVQKSESGNPKDPKFEYFKKKVLDHLAELEKRESGSVAKSIDVEEWILKANFPVGTVRTWNGQKFKKISPKKWARIYEGESRGAKLAIAALRRKAAACKDSEELYRLCMENKERFLDGSGKPLAFMQEFSAYVSGLNDKMEAGKEQKNSESQDSLSKIKAVFGAKTNEQLEQNIKYLQREAKNDASMTVSLAGAERIPIKDAIKTLKDILKEKEEPKLDISKDGLKLHFEGSNKDEELKELKKIAEKAGLSVVQDSNGRTQVTNKMGDGVTILKGDTVRVENGDFIVEKPYGGTVNISKQFNGKTEEPKKTEPKQDNEPPKTDNEPKKKGIESIREKYQSSLSVEGDEDEIYVGKEAIQGKWKLVEADAPSASHDEITFHKTEGFPTAKDGSTVNDRDYEHDTAAQETVIDIASDFDGRALGFDSPIVVTQDGVVTSGNNRTMSSKLAARKGTDSKYIDALKKRAKKFGFSAEDVAKFKHPRVVFETNHSGDYTTDEFAKYNESGKKAKSPIEKAVEVSKRIKPEIIESVAASIGSFDTMGELWADRKAAEGIFNALVQSGMIQKTDLPQYYADGGVTESGKEFVETVLIGSVVNETNIRALNGAKSIRQKLVRAIVPLVENKGMKGYSINKELNEAVAIAVEVANEKAKKEPAFRTVEAYAQQKDMFKQADPVAVELAKKLDGRTQKEFADFMLEMNGGLRPAANGEVDLFLGETESKEDIVNRVLKIGKTVQKALERFFARLGATA